MSSQPEWLEPAEVAAALFCRRHHTANDGEDFFQIARLAAWRAAASWRPDGGVSKRDWMFRKALWSMGMAIRTRRYGGALNRADISRMVADPEVRGPEFAEFEEWMSLDSIALRRDPYPALIRHLDLMAAMVDLTYREATVVTLTGFGDRSGEEVAQLLGVSAERVRYLRIRAFAKMRRRL